MMDLRPSKKKKIEVVNVVFCEKIREKPYLDFSGELLIGKDHLLDAPELEIKFDCYFPAIVRLWPLDRQTTAKSPVVFSVDSGLDTIK